jgi:hypothetical protein
MEREERTVDRAVNDKGRLDPLRALRTLFDDGVWLARLVDPDRMVTATPSWSEIV